MNVLITSIGAKVGLVRALTESAHTIGGSVIGIDADPHAPAGTYLDHFELVCAMETPAFWRQLSEIIRKHQIRLIVPTRDGELMHWAEYAERAESEGVLVAVSKPGCLAICENKLLTCRWLKSQGIDTPATVPLADFRTAPDSPSYPLVAKDPLGSGSREIRTISQESELGNLPASWVLQPLISGPEYTLNCYLDSEGICRCVVPHRRIEIVAGEVNRGITVNDERLIRLAHALTGTLPGARGPMNVQVIEETGSNRLYVIDINPRFGGGYPLVHAAGARFTDWILSEAQGRKLPDSLPPWEESLLMVRYRESQFISNGRPGPTTDF